MQTQTIEDVRALQGATLVGQDGAKIGKVEDIYLDRDTHQPEWALVHTGLFGGKQSFVPLASASQTGGETLQVPFAKDQVKDAPRVDADGELSEAEERQLYEYYGLSYSGARSDSTYADAGQPPSGGGQASGRGEASTGRDASGPNTDDAMTRSEERMRVSKARRPSELVRLKKYITTEQATETVPVEREELRIEREPITDANRDKAMSGPELSEEEHELTLTEDTVQVDKDVVPVERVRVDKDVTTEQQEVSAELRKEQIDVERSGKRKNR